jgi:hypothetical protein
MHQRDARRILHVVLHYNTDARGLARAILADQAVDRPAWKRQAHRVQSLLGSEPARQVRDSDNGFTHGRMPLESVRARSQSASVPSFRIVR